MRSLPDQLPKAWLQRTSEDLLASLAARSCPVSAPPPAIVAGERFSASVALHCGKPNRCRAHVDLSRGLAAPSISAQASVDVAPVAGAQSPLSMEAARLFPHAVRRLTKRSSGPDASYGLVDTLN
jgi:hypothetical protein